MEFPAATHSRNVSRLYVPTSSLQSTQLTHMGVSGPTISYRRVTLGRRRRLRVRAGGDHQCLHHPQKPLSRRHASLRSRRRVIGRSHLPFFARLVRVLQNCGARFQQGLQVGNDLRPAARDRFDQFRGIALNGVSDGKLDRRATGLQFHRA
jgi:hypothetical protein